MFAFASTRRAHTTTTFARRGKLDLPVQTPTQKHCWFQISTLSHAHSLIFPIIAAKFAFPKKFQIANEKKEMSTKSGFEGLPQEYKARAALGGFMSISSVMEQLRTRGQAMKVREVADLLNLDPDTVVRYANEQKIPAFKVGSRWRFDPHALAMWIEQLSILGGEPDAKTAQVEDANA